MHRSDFAWAAGFFDAEGHFSGAGGSPHATASQVDLEPLDVFANTVQLGTIKGPYKRATPEINRRPQWVFYTYGRETRALFQLLDPWLGSYRSDQARRALKERPSSEGSDGFFQRPRREQIAWCAGFFEGEGCFSISGRALTTRIANTDPQLVDRFQMTVRTGHIYGPYERGPRRKDQWVFAATGYENMQGILAMLWPWLSSRRRLTAMALLENHLTFFYGCGHQRDRTRWRKHCPRCFKPGPKPGSKNRRKTVQAESLPGL